MVIDLIATPEYKPVENYHPLESFTPFELEKLSGVKFKYLRGELEEGYAPAVLLPQFYQLPTYLFYAQVVDAYSGQYSWSCYGN